MKIYAEIPTDLSGYAIYQLDSRKIGADDYFGWKAIKQKEIKEKINGKEITSKVDDDEADVIYDEKSSMYQKIAEQDEFIKQLLAEKTKETA